MPAPTNPLTGITQKRKYLKGAARGGEIASGVNMVAKGDTKLGYHDDVERRKEDSIRELQAAASAKRNTRVYMTQWEALSMLTFYNLEMSKEPKQLNSSAPVYMMYDPQRNQFYLIHQ